MADTIVSIRMDSGLKDQFEAFCSDAGMTMTTAFVFFAEKTVSEHRIPFDICSGVPNATTGKAVEDTRKGIGLSKGFSSVKELMEDLNDEGEISSSSHDMHNRHYGSSLPVEDNADDDEWVNIEESDWYREMKEKYTPASNLAFCRKEKKLTRASLGSILGVTGQYVSDMEHERRGISREMAEKIAAALDSPVTLFL